jgi:hypothetical protein
VSDRSGVVSLATAERWFPEGLARLARSLDRVGFAGERRFWRPGTFPDGCPSQWESPFAFKPFCFAEAKADGLRYALWLDSGCMAIRSLDRIFEQIASRGYVLFRNKDFRVGEWSADTALEVLGLDRELAMELPEVNACAMGLDLHSPIGDEFLSNWHAAAREGTAFRGRLAPYTSRDEYDSVRWNVDGCASPDPRVRGHRHDQTVAGILAYRLGMELSSTGFQSVRGQRPPIRPTTMLVNVGRPRPTVPARLLLGRLRGHAVARFGSDRSAAGSHG